MSLFSLNKKATKTVIIIDVGSGSVGACLAVLDRNGPPAILAQTRVDAPLDTARTADKLSSQIAKTAKDALTTLLSSVKEADKKTAHSQALKILQHVENVAIFLPAPWSQLFIGNIRLARKESFPVTPSLIERMVADYVAREKPDTEESQVIDRSAVGIRLNGYAVEDIPKNTASSRIELTIISATAEREFIAALTSLVREILGYRPVISLHPTAVAASYALSAIAPEASNYLICNGEGEVTELLLALEHIPAGSATAPMGCNMILRTLHVHVDMARAEAASALELAKNAESPMQERLGKTLSAAQKECAEGFKNAAEKLIELYGAPQIIYTLGQGSEAKWYADAIAKASFLKNLFPSGVQIQGVQYATISKFIRAGMSLSSDSNSQSDKISQPLPAKSGDIFLALETLFADSRFDERRAFNFKIT